MTGGSDSAVAPFVANLTPGGVAERYSLQYTATYVTMPYLPERHELTYNLRDRSHNRSLIIKTMDLTDRDFLIRMLYKFAY